MDNNQTGILWKLYFETSNKDEVFQSAKNDEVNFPDGVTRDQVRQVLRGSPPANVEVPQPRILYIDIETAPTVAAVWQFWKANVSPEAVVNNWYMLSYSWAFNDGPVESDSLLSHPSWDAGIFDNDSPMVDNLWKLLDEADIVVAHNGNRFDIPKINSRMLVYGMPPPSPFQSVDTLVTLKKKFNFGSNKLAHIARTLSLELKGDSGGMETWMRCVNGETEALQEMVDYNEQDVVVLRDLYKELLPWIPSHPNFGVLMQKGHVCSSCGSGNLVEEPPYLTASGSYPTYRCEDCGAISRTRTTTVPKDVRKDLLVPLAR